MLPHDRPEPTPAPTADAAQRLLTVWKGKAFSMLEGCAFDTSDFEIGVHAICDTAGFDAGTVLLTITNRRERVSRTYLCTSRGPGWAGEFEKDLHAGIFGGRRSAESETDPVAEEVKRIRTHATPIPTLFPQPPPP